MAAGGKVNEQEGLVGERQLWSGQRSQCDLFTAKSSARLGKLSQAQKTGLPRTCGRYSGHMRWVLFLCSFATLWAQAVSINPQQPRQGEVLFVRSDSAVKARLLGQTVRLFPQTDGSPLGLMPVPTLTKPGDYPLELLDGKGN